MLWISLKNISTFTRDTYLQKTFASRFSFTILIIIQVLNHIILGTQVYNYNNLLYINSLTPYLYYYYYSKFKYNIWTIVKVYTIDNKINDLHSVGTYTNGLYLKYNKLVFCNYLPIEPSRHLLLVNRYLPNFFLWVNNRSGSKIYLYTSIQL